MNLLVVMQRFPWPPRTGSALVAYYSIRELARRHSVTMVCCEIPESEGDLAEILEDVHYAASGTEAPRSVLEKVLLLFRGIPPLIWATASPTMERTVAEVADRFDALLLFEFHAIQYCPTTAQSTVVANIEDPPSIKARLYSRLSVYSVRQRLVLLLDAWLMNRYEKRLLPRLAKVLLLSEADMKLMREKGGYDNLGYVNYGTLARDAGGVATLNERAQGAIVFSGNMWHGPNVDGALFFLRSIFSLVLQQAPSAVLWIVGANPDKRIAKAAKRFAGRVVITGQVPNVSEYVSRACVSICPVRVRVGVQTKVLEAMAVGTPVVSTSAGNSGIGGVSGKHLWVADEPASFASRIVELLGGEHWSRLSDEGRKLVLSEFHWERSVSALEGYLSLIANRPTISC